MVRTLDLLNTSKNPYAQADGVNPEGFPSFKRSWQEQYLQMLLTNTLSGTFYAESAELLRDALELHRMAATNPQFMARALVYARNEGLMRLQTILGLAVLAKSDLDLFHQVFARVILTPGDLADFVEIVRGGSVSGKMGRSIKRAVNRWLNGLSEYHAIKYGTGGQGYSLRDILRLTHPKPSTDQQDLIFMWLTDREKWNASEKRHLTPQLEAFEALKQAKDPQSARQLVTTGRLPYEVVTGVISPDVETWHSLMEQMPFMALLRHLNTLQRAGIFRDEAAAFYVAQRLSNVNAILKAKVLPFRLFMAHQMFVASTPNEQLIADALVEALETSFQNMPDLGGKVCIAPDTSGSMSGKISAKSQTRYIDVAGIFSGALLKKSPQAIVMPFDTKVHDAKLSRHDSILSIAAQIGKYGGGGTAVSAPISQLLAQKTVVDTFIGITDNVEWARDVSGGLGFLPVWNEYKTKVAPQAKAFLLTIAPYRHAMAPSHQPDVFYIYGWNDTVLKFISLAQNRLSGQVESVQNLEI